MADHAPLSLPLRAPANLRRGPWRMAVRVSRTRSLAWSDRFNPNRPVQIEPVNRSRQPPSCGTAACRRLPDGPL